MLSYNIYKKTFIYFIKKILEAKKMPENIKNLTPQELANFIEQEFEAEADEDTNVCMSNLVFQITTANNTIPVNKAKVTVTRRDGETIYYYKEVLSDISGKTEPLCIYSLPKSLSLTPEFETPFLTYNATVEAEGYKPVEIKDIRAFTGITAVQPINLVPQRV